MQAFLGLLSKIIFKSPPIAVFAILLLITVFWASFLPTLKFNYDIETFFSSDDPEVSFYDEHRRAFENENDFVLIGIRNKTGIFQQPFLEKLDSLSDVLKDFTTIQKVFSPTNLYEVIKSPLGSARVPLLHIGKPDRYESDKTRVYENENYANSFFSLDEQSVSLLIKKDHLSRQANDSLLLSLNATLKAFDLDEFHIAGRIQTQYYYVNQMKRQMGLFAGLALLLFMGSLFLIFKSPKYVFLSLIVVVISLIWIFGIIAWLGISLDLMLTLLPTLIFVISTSCCIHLISRFRKEYVTGVSKNKALRTAVTETGIPNFLNALTTSIGFASLLMIPVAPIQRFGLFTAMGIIISFGICILLIPTALRVMRLKPSEKITKPRDESIRGKLVTLVFQQPKLVISIFTLIVLFGGYFTFGIKINNHFLDDLSPKSSLKNDLDFFENNFSGIRPFEMSIQAPDGASILDYDALLELDKVDEYLRKEYEAGFLFSPLSFIKSLNKASNGGNQAFYKLPDSEQQLRSVLRLADQQNVWSRFIPVITKDRSVGRISARTHDEGSRILTARNNDLQTFLNENTSLLNFQVTGAAHLMDNANTNIAWSLMKGMTLAILVATIVIGIFTRSWKLAALSLIPNLIPILLVGGFMGATGVPLKVATSIIFTIIYGIAVDDTIHFLNSFRMNKKSGLDSAMAAKQAIAKMWQPMLFTSFVLFSGFMIFTLSAFSSISMLGLLIGGSLIIALFTNLLLLPVLLAKSKFSRQKQPILVDPSTGHSNTT